MTRARNFNLVLIGIWAVLAIVSVIDDFNVGLPVRVALCAIGLYVVFGDAVIRLMRPAKA